MATVGYSFTGLNVNTKALRVGNLLVIADGMTKQQIIEALDAGALRRIRADETLVDSIAIDNGA